MKIGVLGGTFDPIHYGHLRTAFELWQALKLAEVRFLPTGNPPHRERTLADAALRVEMVRAAVADQPPFVVDDREVRRAGASYTVDTLTELRSENPERSLCLLLGMDAFLGLPNWHRWRELFDLAHVVVAHRPGWKAPLHGPLGELMVDRGTGAPARRKASASARTFSGGEELAYDLQALGRARVVGETTGGGAHPRVGFPLTDVLQAHVPVARSVNALTEGNWEGVGVLPDVPCAADDALDVALGR